MLISQEVRYKNTLPVDINFTKFLKFFVPGGKVYLYLTSCHEVRYRFYYSYTSPRQEVRYIYTLPVGKNFVNLKSFHQKINILPCFHVELMLLIEMSFKICKHLLKKTQNCWEAY